MDHLAYCEVNAKELAKIVNYEKSMFIWMKNLACINGSFNQLIKISRQSVM